MNDDHSISPLGAVVASGSDPGIESGAPPPPPPPKVTADFASSAAMAKDILGLEMDAAPPPPPPPQARSATPDSTAASHGAPGVAGPRPVPDLDAPDGIARRPSALPMAPDFFTSSRAKQKKKVWKLSR